jgi:DNA polymerase elongation subunit (family B)
VLIYLDTAWPQDGGKMSYIDALYKKDEDKIYVVERDPKKGRIFTEYDARYVFYYPDSRGKHRSITGEPLQKVQCATSKEFIKEQRIRSNKVLYENDISPVFRCLEENYLGKETPKLNVLFFDIEVDFDPERGYATTDDPFMPITAISCYMGWTDQLITFAIPPKTLSIKEAEILTKRFDNTILFEKEKDMLDAFLQVVDEADIISGWNSEGYDIPYTVGRIQKTMSSDDTRRLCFWGEKPKKRIFEKYGREQLSYDLIGRVHLDLLELYRKYTYEERHSFRLDAIGEHELGERKTVYEGSLDALYNNDFALFIEYNRQDTNLLAKLEKKLKFIELANEIAHQNTVLLQTTMGAVAVTEQAIVNEAHRRGMIVPGRKYRDKDAEPVTAAGAYVATPKKGLHDWIGSVDINSLYPSVIRALNMGPETIVGQVRPIITSAEINRAKHAKKSFAAAWDNQFGSWEYQAIMAKERGTEVVVDWSDETSVRMSAAQLHDVIFDGNNKWMISANGTIFTYEQEGIIPGLLKRWYAERKEMQKKMHDAGSNDIEREYWDKRQLVKKINLNSLYGAILNPGCRFFDLRIGQSVTLTGRCITKHMGAKVNEIVAGKYDHVGESIIYGDTDSVYFSAHKTLASEIESGKIPWSKESVVGLYDKIADEVNTTFAGFMNKAFHCPTTRGAVIKAGRELVAVKGLFITKKRYAVLYYDKEGERVDNAGKEGKVKAMGVDLKRSDTPVFVQDFLSDILYQVLTGVTEEEVLQSITDFREEFKARPGWEKGSPKRANNMTKYSEEEAKKGKTNMPGHVRASMNWNKCREMYGDKYSMPITDGAKVIVCKLKNNPLNYTSIAYPTDELRIPDWFKELPFDNEAMEQTILDQKLDNLIGVLDWDIQSTETSNTFNKLFEF